MQGMQARETRQGDVGDQRLSKLLDMAAARPREGLGVADWQTKRPRAWNAMLQRPERG